MQQRKPNRLAAEKSPYLQEHAFNPVDWFPWSDEARKKARNDRKPILLSIGYSTCHWCHVMRKESFEDERTAAYINKNFIPVKVDREERPEVDAYYMKAVQAMTGGGGWPLTVFLTPDLKPFYGGTYFPPEARYGMPSFMRVLEFVNNLWKEKSDEVRSNSELVLQSIEPGVRRAPGELTQSLLDECYTALVSSFDDQHGGFGKAPKFPLPGTLSFLLRYHRRTGKDLALRAAVKTLDEMMAGGIRDHVGGGFHRYSTDRVWLVPHFEKMLYDNALLAKLFTEAYQITRKPGYSEVAREALGWIIGEMKGGEGGFFSAQDADTVEGEGTYYTWTPEEVRATLGQEEGLFFDRLYGVTKTGNFEGRSILHLESGVQPTPNQEEAVAESKRALYRARIKRPRPATDTKVLTSWNGLAVSALAFSSMVFDEPAYTMEGRSAARFVLDRVSEGGRLLRRFADGEAGLEGTLEDYAFFAQGLIDLFEATSEATWLQEAIRLTDIMLDDFQDTEGGGFYLSTDDVPAKLKEGYDGPTPSGNSVASLNLVRLAEITGEERFRKVAGETLKSFSTELDSQPSAHTTMMTALDLLFNGAQEIVISAPSEDSALEMRREVFRTFIPDKVVLTATSRTFDELSKLTSLLNGRKPEGKAKAFVCRNFTCKVPADSVQALREQLEPTRS